MNKFFYLSPAKVWRHALPLGNGHTGVMLYGGKSSEKLVFNDTNLWSGYPKNHDNPESLEYLEEVRELIMMGENLQAQQIIEEKFVGDYSDAYLPLGEIYIKIIGANKRNYSRSLDLANAIVNIDTANIQREAFASFPAKVFVYKITAKTPISITLNGKSKLKHEIDTTDGNFNILGNAPDFAAPHYLKTKKVANYDEGKGMSFCLSAKLVTNGSISTNQKSILVSKATEITIYFATATGFVGFDKMPKTSRKYALELTQKTLTKLSNNYEQIKQNHIADYNAIYSKQSLDLKSDIDLPTDKLLKEAKLGRVHNGLVELIYNYGKYLLISSSRKGSSGCNLQGIWNKDLKAAWSSNYTTNINTEMNYWGMSQCNLSECAEPFVRMVDEIMQHGKTTAHTNYNCDGFACNHNVDIWRKTAPVKGESEYMFAPLCGVWLANELYEHLRYGDMEKYRDKVQTITTEAAKFACDYLILRKGEYITCPSTSPEASFIKDGKKCSVDYASAFDLGLIRQVFDNYMEFGTDKALLQKISQRLSRLRTFTCGEYGLNEWSSDYTPSEKGHRHFSPLYSFYPAKIIGYYRNPQEREWVEKLFNRRIQYSSSLIGWSSAWAISLAARLRDAETAKTILDKMIKMSFFKNLFDTHPPFFFQIDGNLGFLSAINELLVTEEDGVIELLPALSDKFSEGEIKNIRTATGNVLSFAWKDGLITSLSVVGKPIKLRNLHLDKNLILENAELI